MEREAVFFTTTSTVGGRLAKHANRPMEGRMAYARARPPHPPGESGHRLDRPRSSPVERTPQTPYTYGCLTYRHRACRHGHGPTRRDGGTGRRAGLKNRWPRGREGSSPSLGTTIEDASGRGGIGRRAWFRSMSPQGGGGSSPLDRTIPNSARRGDRERYARDSRRFSSVRRPFPWAQAASSRRLLSPSFARIWST